MPQRYHSEVYSARITRISYRYIRVEFIKDDTVQEGYISLHNLGTDIEEGSIHSIFSVGEELLVELIRYSPEYSNWYMRVASDIS